MSAATYDEQLQRGLSISGENKEFFASQRMEWLRQRLDGLTFQARNCLDFGCGTGTSTPYFFDLLNATSVIGADPSEASLEIARADWGSLAATYVQPEAVPEGGIDLAFCNGVFHHIDPENRAGAAALVYRSLRPGGLFAFWENNPWNPLTRLSMRRVPFDADAIMLWPGETRRLLKGCGFEVLFTDYKFFFPRPLAALRFLEPSLRWCVMGAQYLVLCRKPG
ncbi:methyltransferase domain-containing protein [Luteolibacter sp. SL250]|uniref:class I SAM-dependent methyltransferase n=1 Tax=Luteolibacter sp. SL250 TaxID=2995170 RepID=UPI0022711427|nr:class I SAM-dependent methyltransferase [Luteolibacter sp. SL250]WAC19632.1 methyltransferase domain-containing protein [Luteolibacter sp. SL250]